MYGTGLNQPSSDMPSGKLTHSGEMHLEHILGVEEVLKLSDKHYLESYFPLRFFWHSFRQYIHNMWELPDLS